MDIGWLILLSKLNLKVCVLGDAVHCEQAQRVLTSAVAARSL